MITEARFWVDVNFAALPRLWRLAGFENTETGRYCRCLFTLEDKSDPHLSTHSIYL